MLLLAILLSQAAAPAVPAAPPSAAERAAASTTPSGLRFEEVRPGTGRHPGPEDAVLVTYEGRLADGTVFDAAAEPVGFAVAGVVPGFAEALMMMARGGTYRFWIPPELGYGAAGSGPIPPNATLEFTVTLVDIGRPVREPPRQPAD
jgi:FKBP-type peptidyl-prolyl cis-trans isomerase